jgi:D-inositol-3-phosphate glycosyltransferase
MKRLLFFGETPAIETGAGQLSKHLLRACKEAGYSITVVGINHHSSLCSYDRDAYPFIVPAPQQEMHNLDNAKYYILRDHYDVLFLTGDINILDELMDTVSQVREQSTFLLICLPAIDNDIFHRQYLRCLEMADVAVVLSHYAASLAYRQVPGLAGKLHVIQPGVDAEVFHPLPPEERQAIRKAAFDLAPDTFLVININRNSARKDLARSMAAFHLFHKRNPKSVLYLHAKQEDIGGSLPTQAHLLGLQIAGDSPEIIFAPPEYHEVSGVSRAALNALYNAADCCISTSTGEGWGLTTVEAMAAGTSFIGPANTTFREILGDGRGYLVESGGADLWTVPYGLSEGPREIVSCLGMAEKIEHVFFNYDEAQKRAKEARFWAEGHTWQKMVSSWLALFADELN